jgi:hypothetical protein
MVTSTPTRATHNSSYCTALARCQEAYHSQDDDNRKEQLKYPQK